MEYLFYGGFTGTVNFSEEDNLYYGEILGISDSVSYQGKTEDELFVDFKDSIYDYIDLILK